MKNKGNYQTIFYLLPKYVLALATAAPIKSICLHF